MWAFIWDTPRKLNASVQSMSATALAACSTDLLHALCPAAPSSCHLGGSLSLHMRCCLAGLYFDAINYRIQRGREDGALFLASCLHLLPDGLSANTWAQSFPGRRVPRCANTSATSCAKRSKGVWAAGCMQQGMNISFYFPAFSVQQPCLCRVRRKLFPV